VKLAVTYRAIAEMKKRGMDSKPTPSPASQCRCQWPRPRLCMGCRRWQLLKEKQVSTDSKARPSRQVIYLEIS